MSMTTTSIVDKFNRRADAANSLLCVGLDSAVGKLPQRFRDDPTPQFAFNRWIIDQTHPYVAAYKPNIAFYEARGAQGLHELKLTMDYLHDQHPDIFVVCDAKRGDNSTSNMGYVEEIFDWFGFDAVTLHPYMGKQTLQPFLSRADKGCIILCRTSNPGDDEYQELIVDGKPLWQTVAARVRDDWNVNGNCMLVVGATQPEALAKVREIIGDMTILVPGVGAQGGSVQDAVIAGINQYGKGLIVNASRSVIFADNPAAEAEKLRDEINRWR